MDVRLLGPIELSAAGKSVSIGGPKPRTLLALLASNVGRVVSLDEIVDAVWNEDPPEQAKSAIYTYVSLSLFHPDVDALAGKASC